MSDVSAMEGRRSGRPPAEVLRTGLVHALAFVLLFSGPLVMSPAEAQSCIPFEGSPATSHKCDPLVIYPNVFLQPNLTYQQIDEQAAAKTKLFGAFVPPACRDSALRFICLGSFVECAFSLPQGLIVRPPCRDVCEEMVDDCVDFFTAQGKLAMLPNCTTLPLTNCNNGSQDIVVPYSQADCPYPLKFNDEGTIVDPAGSLGSPDQVCVYPCPDPTFSDSEWQSATGILISLSILSLSMSLFMVLTWCLNPQGRRFPSNLQTFLALSSVIISLGVLLSVLVGGPKRTYCTWDDQPVLQTWDLAGENGGQGVVCILQSLFIVFGTLAAAGWWLMLTVTAFYMIVLRSRGAWFKKLLPPMTHVVGWGLPSIGCIIGLAAQQLGPNPAQHFCFIVNPWDWGLWHGPVIVIFIIGTLLMTTVLIKVWVVRARLKDSNQTTLSVEHLLRLAGLILVYWMIYALYVGLRIYLEVDKGTIQASIKEQVMCSASTGEECELKHGMNPGVWYLAIFVIGAQGIIIFTLMGLSKSMVKFWMRLLRNWRHPMTVIKGSSSSSKSTIKTKRGSQAVSRKDWKLTPISSADSLGSSQGLSDSI